MAIRTGEPAAGTPGPEELGDGLARMTLLEHLAELRRRLIICAIAVSAGAVLGWLVYNHILHFMQQPYCQTLKSHPSFKGANGCNFVITNPLEGVTTRLKVSGYFGLTLALPLLLFQFWRFVTPGLHSKEKKYVLPFVLTSVVLFALGAAVAVLTWPQALNFLIGVSGQGVSTFFSPSKYIGLYSLVIIAFGLSFEFPVILVFLELVGVLGSAKLLSWWRYAVVLIFIAAAVITPSQDPYSLFGMALPMCLFYFMSIGIGKLLKK